MFAHHDPVHISADLLALGAVIWTGVTAFVLGWCYTLRRRIEEVKCHCGARKAAKDAAKAGVPPPPEPAPYKPNPSPPVDLPDDDPEPAPPVHQMPPPS